MSTLIESLGVRGVPGVTSSRHPEHGTRAGAEKTASSRDPLKNNPSNPKNPQFDLSVPRGRLPSNPEGNRCLIPFDRREGLSLAAAAKIAGKSVDTVRLWCLDHGIGRKIGDGAWVVSRVALTMFLEDDHRALKTYLAGDRSEPVVAAYFHRLGLEGLLRDWARFL